MKDAKINTNRPEISSEEINQTKNFNQVLNHSKSKKIKTAGVIGVLLSLLIIGLIIFKNNEPKKELKIIENTLPKIDFKSTPEEFIINPDESHILTTKDSSIIEVPSNAFMLNGNVVDSDSILIKFEKYETIPEIFRSQIPMTYDSANYQFHFESAGMFTIKAFDFNGNELNTNPNALIKVKMSSNNDANRFNQYYLDSDSNWSYITTVKPQIENNNINNKLEKNQNLIALKKSEIDQEIKANIPTLPSIADENKIALNLKFDNKEFPELSVFKGILFQIDQTNIDIDEISSNWNDFELKKEDNNYTLSLFKSGVNRSYKVTPVIQEVNRKNAQKKFQSIYTKYEKKNKDLFKERQKVIDSLQIQNKAIKDSINQLNNNANNTFYKQTEEEALSSKIYRIFTINNFGTYNSDCPHKLPKGFDIEEPIFVNKKNPKDTLKFNRIYLAEYGNNTLFTLLNGSYNDLISFNPKKKTVLWGVTRKNKLAVLELDRESLENGLAMELHELTNETNKDYIRKKLKWQ